jgi:hypothetical protein
MRAFLMEIHKFDCAVCLEPQLPAEVAGSLMVANRTGQRVDIIHKNKVKHKPRLNMIVTIMVIYTSCLV